MSFSGRRWIVWRAPAAALLVLKDAPQQVGSNAL